MSEEKNNQILENGENETDGKVYSEPRGFSSKKNIIIIIVAALLMIGGVGAIVAVNVTKSNSQNALTDIQIAERYLSEQNYEQAIIEFEKILEIEPMNVDAYLGLAEAYIGKGDTEKALEILRKGLEQTGDTRLQARIDELTKPAESPSSSTSSTPSVTNEIVYGDAECLAIEEMIEAYLRGEGEIDTSKLQNVTNLEILGTEVIVWCGLRTGTEIRGTSHTPNETIFTLHTPTGNVEIPYGSIDNINEDLPFLLEMPLLRDLTIRFNQISDISALSGLSNLTVLRLSCNQLIDIIALSGLTNLKYLNLANNQIGDISALSGLSNLTDLRLSGNQISDISALSGITNLKCLYLDFNQISDISALSGLSNLTNLRLSGNQLSDISALSGLTNLTYLSLQTNQISDITPLAGLTNLTCLYLDGNQISDISPIEGLTKLEVLGLMSNQLDESDKQWIKNLLPHCKISINVNGGLL